MLLAQPHNKSWEIKPLWKGNLFLRLISAFRPVEIIWEITSVVLGDSIEPLTAWSRNVPPALAGAALFQGSGHLWISLKTLLRGHLESGPGARLTSLTQDIGTFPSLIYVYTTVVLS